MTKMTITIGDDTVEDVTIKEVLYAIEVVSEERGTVTERIREARAQTVTITRAILEQAKELDLEGDYFTTLMFLSDVAAGKAEL